MAKVLAIFANPRKKSYTRRLMEAFLISYQQSHPLDEVVELDLYETDIPVIDDKVLQAWSKPCEELSQEEQQVLARVDAFTLQFMAAEKIVFAAPMWNLQFPPVLLAYLANIMVAGKTFCYTETGSQGLLADKPTLLLHVQGGIYSSGPLQALDYAVPYLRAVCKMMGISNFQTVLCDGIEMFPDKAEEILERAMHQAAQLAERF